MLMTLFKHLDANVSKTNPRQMTQYIYLSYLKQSFLGFSPAMKRILICKMQELSIYMQGFFKSYFKTFPVTYNKFYTPVFSVFTGLNL